MLDDIFGVKIKTKLILTTFRTKRLLKSEKYESIPKMELLKPCFIRFQRYATTYESLNEQSVWLYRENEKVVLENLFPISCKYDRKQHRKRN